MYWQKEKGREKLGLVAPARRSPLFFLVSDSPTLLVRDGRWLVSMVDSLHCKFSFEFFCLIFSVVIILPMETLITLLYLLYY